MLDDDWAGHTMNTQLLIAPTGELIARHWKQRNMRGMWPGVEQFTTTIYDVYDRYVEMYGLDAVIPVERTAIGNIPLSSVPLVRTSAGGGKSGSVREDMGGRG